MTYLTGGTVTEIDGYRIHVFTTSGTLTVVQQGDAECLVVAGGGGSGGGSPTVNAESSGGGGAGEVQHETIAITSNQAITVGPGGAGGAGWDGTSAGVRRGDNGSDSSIGALLEALGGGGGGAAREWAGASPHNEVAGADGGSGGGAGETGIPGYPGGAAIGTGLGYAGGSGYAGRSGGGGGGAGGVGADAQNTNPTTPGGPGYTTDISGASVTYAEGGWSPRDPSSGTSQPANRGHGGIAVSESFDGNAGSSGIVIVRYPLVVVGWKVGSI